MIINTILTVFMLIIDLATVLLGVKLVSSKSLKTLYKVLYVVVGLVFIVATILGLIDMWRLK